ncbi:MAG: modified peptide precursor CbpA [Candidatus Omnitrophica bacterium]|nr:modified peptide precursor CbpA [Candidatus Omnitrophota bacterium]
MKERKAKMRKDVIACRKRCKANGTGLAHYVLTDKK